MSDVLGVTAPIFALIGLGYLLVWRGLFRGADLPVLGRYVMNVALPALLFTAVAQSEPAEVFRAAYLLPYGLATLGSMAAAWALFSLPGESPTRRAVAVLGAGCANSGYVGYPLLSLAMPHVAGQVLAMNVVIENFLALPLALAAMDATKTGGGGLAKLPGVLWGVVRRPMVLALIAGVLVMVSGVTIPVPAMRVAEILAAGTSGVALLVIGGNLVGLSLQGNVSAAGRVVFAKLVLHPAFAVLALALTGALGFALPGELRTALVLTCAMPMLGIYAILAEDLGHAGMASISLLLATLCAFFTLSGLLALLT